MGFDRTIIRVEVGNTGTNVDRSQDPATGANPAIQAVMKEIGAEKVVQSINFRQPYAIDDASGLRRAGAIVAGFSVSNADLLDVPSGKAKPQGKLPFALANNLPAVIDNQPDAPGYSAKDTLFHFRLRSVLLTPMRARSIVMHCKRKDPRP